MLHLSPSALDEIVRLKLRHHSSDALFRLAVQPTGCMGLSYRLEFDETAQPNDQVYDCGKVQVVIDAASLPYVDGLALDYSEDLMGGGFRFRNPNAAQTCSCGNSFSVSS